MKNSPFLTLLFASLGLFFIASPAAAQTVPPPWFYNDSFHTGIQMDTVFVSGNFSGNTITLSNAGFIGKIQYYTTTSVLNDTINASSTNNGYAAGSYNIQTEVTNAGLGDGQYIVGLSGGSPNKYCFFTVLLGQIDLSHCEGAQNPVPWDAISFPQVYSTTSAAIAASSTLWGAYASSSQLQATCSTGNIFGDAFCTAISFLFLPNPNVINAYTTLFGTVLPTKFPFSLFFGVSAEFSTLSASSTANLGTVSINFSSVPSVASSSFGALLPNVTILSTSTITHYMPSGFWSGLQFLITCALWIGLATDIFYEVRNKLHRV